MTSSISSTTDVQLHRGSARSGCMLHRAADADIVISVLVMPLFSVFVRRRTSSARRVWSLGASDASGRSWQYNTRRLVYVIRQRNGTRCGLRSLMTTDVRCPCANRPLAGAHRRRLPPLAPSMSSDGCRTRTIRLPLPTYGYTDIYCGG